MSKIFYIMGMSGSGKTTLYNKLVMLKDSLNINPLIQYTTRPKRDNEKDNIDYHFINDNKFINMIDNKEFIEFRIYNTNNGIYKYGTAYKDIEKNKNYISSGSDIDAYIKIKEKLGDDIIPIFLYTSDDIILSRIIDRCKDRKEYKEACRRFIDDIDRYDVNKAKYEYKIPSDNCFDSSDNSVLIKVMQLIYSIIK